MPIENRSERELTLQQLRARQLVTEAVQTQLMLRLATLFDHPGEFVRLMLDHAERSLQSGLRAAPEGQAVIAEDALAYFEQYSLAIAAAITPKDNPQ